VSRGVSPVPAGAYASAVQVGRLVVTAGMTPRRDGRLVETGVVGRDISVDRAGELTVLAVERAITAVDASCAASARRRPVQLTVWLRTTDDFDEHTRVADSASALLARWGDGTLPARAAVGVTSLPGGAPVEIVLVAEVGDG